MELAERTLNEVMRLQESERRDELWKAVQMVYLLGQSQH